MFFVVFPVFVVPTNSKFCVVATRTDGTKYLVDSFSTQADALSYVGDDKGLSVVYSSVLDLLKTL